MASAWKAVPYREYESEIHRLVKLGDYARHCRISYHGRKPARYPCFTWHDGKGNDIAQGDYGPPGHGTFLIKR